MAQKFLTNFTPPGNSDSYKFRAGALFYGTTSNSTSAMTVSIPGVTEYYTGLTLVLKMGAQPASGCTLNVNSLGAKKMLYGASSEGTYFTSGATYLFVYDGTQFKAIHSYNSNTTYSVVTSAANGLVPKFDAADGTIDSSSSDWVLTNNNGSIGWYKMPANAFKNDNTNYYHTPSYTTGLKVATGSGVGDLYIPAGTTSSLGVVKQHGYDDCTTYSSDEGATTPKAVKKAFSLFGAKNGIFYVAGNTSGTAGTWTGTNTEIPSLFTGLTIAYKIGIAGASATTLNLTTAAGASGAKTVRRNTGALTTHLGVGSIVHLTYDGTYWVWADYDSNTKNTAGSSNTSSKIFLVGATSQASSATTYSHDTVYVGTDGHLYDTNKQVSVVGHTHNYAGSSSAGGAANSVKTNLTIKLNGGTTEGTNLFTFNGSTAKTINITPSAIGAATSSHTHDDRYYTESETNTKLNAKLDKLTYEWNKEYNAGGTAGYLLIGSFPMYDTNVTIDIDATTTTTYHGTVVIATQNVSTTSIGSAHTITVYGDPTGDISNAIRVTWASGSRNYNVYFIPSTWSKNLIHIRAIGQYMDTIDTTKICTQFTTGTAPATTSGLTVVNALRSNFNNFTYTHPTTSGNKHIPAGGSKGQILRWSADGTAVWGNDNNTTYTFTNKAATLAWGTKSTIATVGGVDITVTMPANPNTNTHYVTGITAGATGTTSNSATTNGNTFIKIKDDSTHRGQIKIVGSGATTVTSDANGVITIKSTDNNTVYTHPTSSGNKHIPSGGSSGQILRWSADGTAAWGSDNNTTYSAGTGLTLDGTTFKVTSANVSTMMNLLGEGTSPAQQNDYLIAQYAGGGTTTTTYHRRKVSNIITADNVKKALGTGTGTTKYLREDGTWVTPPNSNSAHSHSAGLGLTGSGSAGTSGTYTYKVNLVNEAVASNAASYTAGGTSKFYAVQLDKNNKLGVYVPWSNTTYSSMSINEGTTGTATTSRVLTAANLKGIINAHAPTKTGGGASGKWGISITGSAGSVAWGNITGKPSTFTPSSHSHDFITYKDTRADNQSPDDVQAGLTVHLKSNGTDGISDGGSYHAVLNVKDWGDYSGGPYWQSTVTENNNMYFRRSTAGTTWGAWQKVLSDNNYTNYTVTKTGSGASGTWGINVTGRARFLETKHQDGSAWYGDNYPLYAQWETSNICKIKCDNYYTKVDYANSATKATQDGSGNVITSKYVTLDTAQTISGTKTMTGSLKVSGRYAGSGDDEGIIVGFANNGYAGLCLGGPSEARSVFYFKSDGTNPFWRYNNGSASYDISHPSKSGTIALTSDLAKYLPLSGGTLTGLLNITTNGKTTTFGCQNSSYSHYSTNADVGHWFNKNTYVQGNIYAGSSYNKLVLTEENYTNYAPTKTGGGASGKWKISITGNAATATKLATARTISLTGAVTGSGSFDGSGNLSIATTSNHNHDSTYVNVSGDKMTGNLTINKSGARTVYTDGTTSIWCGMNSDGNSFGIYNTTGEKYIIRMNGDVVKSGYPIYGAVWNDYAEFRICKNNFKAGQVVLENGDDTLSIASKRLQRGCSIISDTFGFAIGETDEAKCPIAVSGRVLAYGYESREEFKKHIGWPVCSGPNGTVSIMTEEEEEKYPSRIIGTISAVPDYETWGTGNIEVNNRIWIKIK